MKADTIQIVRAAARHPLRRTYIAGEWYLQFGSWDVPNNQPEIVTEYVYELVVVETLKGATQTDSAGYENSLRIRAYDAGEWYEFYRVHNMPLLNPEEFNALPEWLIRQPGRNGYPYTGGTVEGAGLGGGPCNGPYFMEVGQTYIAFRDSMGRLYWSGVSASNALLIDAEFQTERGRRHRSSFKLQALVPIRNSDTFLTRLRSALLPR